MAGLRPGRPRTEQTSGPSRRVGRLASCLFLLTAAAVPARALDPSRALTQYRLDIWGSRDALPAHTIASIAQTADGYLWFAARDLIRFDGVTFTTVELGSAELPVTQVLSVAASEKGGLWVLTVPSGLLHYKNGALRKGPHAGSAGTITTGRGGSLWHVAGNVVAHIRGGGLAQRRVPIVQPRALVEDPDGTVWVSSWDASEGGVTRIRGDEITRYGRPQGLDSFVSSLVRTRDGTLWAGTRRGLSALSDDGNVKTYTTRDGLSDDFVTTLLADRDGSLWIGTSSGGVCRFREGRFSTLRQVDGLSDDEVSALFEDDEGGIWVAGRGALGRLRSTSFTTYTKREGLPVDGVMEAYPASAGGVWASTYGGGLTHITGDRFTTYEAGAGLASAYVGPVFEAADGSVWFGDGSNQLSRLKAGRVETFDTGKRYVWAIAEDKDGIVVALPRFGLFRLQGRDLVPYRGAAGETLADPQMRMLKRARDGSLWIGSNLGLANVKDGAVVRYSEAQGLKGTVFSIVEDARGVVWIASSAGLARLAGGQIQMFDGVPYLSGNSIPTIVEDDTEHLWFNSVKGLGRVSIRELEARAERRSGKVAVRMFTAKDGLKIEEIRTTPTVQRGCRTADGRLWFPTARGLSVVDPRRLFRDEKPPPLLIEQVVVDGRVEAPRDQLVVPAGAEKVEIRYTALSYTLPERVTFKYMLEGFDAGWIDARSRRTAYYTKLPPGDYRFRVRAMNSDGVANDVGASLYFSQQPRIYQTLWFRLLLIVPAALAVLSAHRIRVRHLEARERDLTARVEAALGQIKTLHGLLPICASCKKIRDDSGYWNLMETYIGAHSSAEFSHSVCPECIETLYPDYAAHAKDHN
jgi:ligand-binding sensor domain-containing protein